VFGFLFLGLVMGRYGPSLGLLATSLAGAGGNLLAWLADTGNHHSLGASGVVTGALGLLSIPSVVMWKRRNAHTFRLFTVGILAGLLMFVFLGLSPETDVVAHLGGFIAGLLLGALLTVTPRLAHQRGVNLIAGILFTILVVLPWWRALHLPHPTS